MKKLRVMILILLITGVLASTVLGQEKPLLPPGSIQQTCFIMKGNPINSRIYTDYQGYRLYFCCRDCQIEFKQHPDKYLQTMLEADFPLEKTPETK